MSERIEMIIRSRARDLGGFFVHRTLPSAQHRMVGPFIFFDHMGPADFPPGHGINVRPHPHINLATVTYLFSGRIHHRDSLGSSLVIEPGAINWMTAGRGVVHSERAPEDQAGQSTHLHGIQLWVALPEKFEEMPPSFAHHPKETLPEFNEQGVPVKLLLGKLFDHESPVKVHSDLFYAEAKLKAGQKITLKTDKREAAVYVVNGKARVEDEVVSDFSMVINKDLMDLTVEALEDTRVMFLGGSHLGDRHIYWNFVSSSAERIESAKKDWQLGPREKSERFTPIPGDDGEFIPLPPK